MGEFNIVTSLVVDNEEQDQKIHYPMIGHFDRHKKQSIYWKLAYAYFAVSTRINPGQNHILFTNDLSQTVLRRFDFKKELQKLDVDIKILPFQKYYIPGTLIGRFKNTLYKLEVYDALQDVEGNSVFMDLDCLWTDKWENLSEILHQYDLLVLDRTVRRSETEKVRIKKEMGEMFKKMDSKYPVQYPNWYGGGFIGGSPASFKKLSTRIKEVFDILVARAREGTKYVLPYNGESMLDGDENIQSYVCNEMDFKLFDVDPYVKIVFTSISFNNASTEDYKYKIWHLASEKLRGLSLLFNEVKNENSPFWSLPHHEIKYFIGKYVGIDKKPVQLKLKQLLYRTQVLLSGLSHPRNFFTHFRYYVFQFFGLR